MTGHDMRSEHLAREATAASPQRSRPWIQLNRHELAGAFGDIGTDLPLLVGVILAADLNPIRVFVVFGLMQVFSSFVYGIPMAVQPLKAVAALVITRNMNAETLYGAGISIGLVMLLLALSGVLDSLSRLIPKPVVRGIQVGLGFQLSILALRQYIPSEGQAGLALAALCAGLIILLRHNQKYPAALAILALGAVYSAAIGTRASNALEMDRISAAGVSIPTFEDMAYGFLLLALPQIPLSLGNSILATRQIAQDLFPERAVTAKRIGLTYSFMNLTSPFFGGIPVCHGSGGLAGHYAFGARTGGSTLIYGLFYVIMGWGISLDFVGVASLFPLPVLGVILFVEGMTLLCLSRDMLQQPTQFGIALLVGCSAVLLPNGYLTGMLVGTLLHLCLERFRCQWA